MPRSNCQTAGCNTRGKHKGISTFLISKAKFVLPTHKNGRKNNKHIFFSFTRLCFNQHHAIEYHGYFYSYSLFKKAAITIAILGEKTLHWQLNKIISFCMYNCNFEAIKSVLNERMKKVEMEYKPCIYKTITYLMLQKKIREELSMLNLLSELATLARDFHSYNSLQV